MLLYLKLLLVFEILLKYVNTELHNVKMWCYFYNSCYNWICIIDQDATIEQLSEAFYDNFDLKLDNVQVIVAGKGTTFNTTYSDCKA